MAAILMIDDERSILELVTDYKKTDISLLVLHVRRAGPSRQAGEL